MGVATCNVGASSCLPQGRNLKIQGWPVVDMGEKSCQNTSESVGKHKTGDGGPRNSIEYA